jgi:hypothetical protein
LNDILPLDHSYVRCLPPARKQLASIHAQHMDAVASLAKLEAGRQKLAARIDKAEAAAGRESAQVDAEASAVLESIKRGLEWALSPRKRQPVSHDLQVERAALAKLDDAIAAQQAAVETLNAQLTEAANAALIAHAAATIGAEYQAALEAVRAAMTKLEGLEVALGRGRDGRTVGEVPGYAVAGHELSMTAVAAAPTEIAAAVDTWRSLAKAWMADPRALPGRVLKFAAKHQPDETTPYHLLSAAERRLVDAKFAATNV